MVELREVPAVVLLLVIVGTVAVVGMKISEQLANNEITSTQVYANLTSTPGLSAKNVTQGIMQVSQQLSLLGLVIIMAAVVFLLMRSFSSMFSQGGNI